MKRRISLLLAALLLAASASARRNPIEIAGYILDGRIVSAETFDAADKGPLIVLRSGGKEYTVASWPVVETNAVKSVTVLKDDASRSLFETYGDTSKGVILVDLRENAELPADARIIRIPSKSEPSQSADTGDKAAAKPLMLVTDGQSVPKAVKTLGTIKADDVESMTIIKNDDARKYDSYGDTSKGVILVRFKEGRLPKRFE